MGRPTAVLQLLSPQSKRLKKHSKLTAIERLAVRVSEKLEDGAVKGAVQVTASDELIATYCQETIDALTSKRRQATRQSHCVEIGIVAPLVLQEPVIATAVKTFPAGSAGGLDGLRPQHLKDMIGAQTGAAGQRMLTRLTKFTIICLAGRVPLVVRPVFCGASLCALSKKGGDIRTIAVGCTLRRLVTKAACSAVRDRVTQSLTPLQLGFGEARR
jgi:hypothetical protein